MPPRTQLRFAPLDPEAFRVRYLLASADEPDLTLRQLLTDLPALALDNPVPPVLLDSRVTTLNLQVSAPGSDTPLYLPLPLARQVAADGARPGHDQPTEDTAVSEQETEPPVISAHPESLRERQAVLIAHAEEIAVAAAYLKRGMSVLIQCEMLLVEHLARRIATLSERPHHRIQADKEAGGGALAALAGGNRRAEMIAGLEKAVKDAVPGDIVLIPHLDLLGGGTDASLSNEGRELTDLLYEHSDRVLLAFTDPSLVDSRGAGQPVRGAHRASASCPARSPPPTAGGSRSARPWSPARKQTCSRPSSRTPSTSTSPG